MTTNAVKPEIAIDDLEATIHLLQEELEATNREVMLLTLELEQRVEERTAQLADSNRELRKEVVERIRAEAEIKNLNKDLEQRAALLTAANEDLEAFSASVSHDLRNPLSSILGCTSILRDDAVSLSEEKRSKHLAHIYDAAQRMTALIDDLLRFSHSSQVELIYSHVNLNQLIAAVILDLEKNTQALQAQKVGWSCGSLPTVWGDASLLQQVFVNLLANALKYSRNESASEIEVGAINLSSETWTIFVRDNGVGFDPRKADKLFGAFQRLHSSQEFEGTGIGLANVRRIILRHGGRVWAESRPNEGATFYVSLPKQ